jgi:hypothetical protein
MLDAIWTKIKTAAKFVWNWLTVLTALITTALSFGANIVMSIPSDQLSILLQPSMALKITAGAAALKAAIEAVKAQMATKV